MLTTLEATREDRGLAFIVRLGLKRSLCILLLCFNSAYATTWQTNGTATNVQYTHDNLAHDGDTITVPAGTFTWTSKVSFAKAITLQGAGIGKTIVNDALRATNQTVHFDLVPGKASRMTGIEFRNSGAVPRASFMGVVGEDQRTGYSMRIDHCKFDSLKGHIQLQTALGVADHNVIITNEGGFFHFRGSYWNGATSLFGDESIHAPIQWGSGEFFFVEDNNYRGTSSISRGMCDADTGARFVIRHNTITDGVIASHGTDSGGRQRTSLAEEIYNNRFIETSPAKGLRIGSARGGVTILHDNTTSGWPPAPNFVLSCYRMFMGSWDDADGTNPWDINRPGGPFYSGTAPIASSGLTVTVFGNPGWTANQWAGYSVKRTTNLRNKTDLGFSEIKSNTSNTLTYTSAKGFKPDLSFAAGDSLQIWKVDQALDQPGVSGGSLLSGNPATIPPGWNNQAVTPCYSWNNTREEDGSHFNFGFDTRVVRSGVHYFNNTVKPGYTPYTYPHPLVSGAPPQPTPTPTPTATPTLTATPRAPTNLRASAVSSSRINLSWADNSNNETGFVINRTQDPSRLWNYVTTVGANVTSYSNTGLRASTTYYYRVQAINAIGGSTWSNRASAKTQ